MLRSMQNQTRQTGFTLVELMITVAIVGILAAVAIPAYQDYTRRARYAEVINAATPLKQAVATCANSLGTVTGCDGGGNGIPADKTGMTGQVDSVEVADGVITVTPNATNGITAGDTYILTPTLQAAGNITWAVSGGGAANGFVNS